MNLNNKFDLHLHSKLSDGQSTREELLIKLINEGFKYVSFTDHNISDGCESILNDRITIINGVEIDCFYENKKIHMLGYGIKDNSKINLTMNQVSKINDTICRNMIRIINRKHDNIITKSDLKIYDNTFITKRNIATILLSKFPDKNIDYVYNNFIGSKSETYIKQEKMDVVDSINLIYASGGIPILAHPITIYRQCANDIEFETIIQELKNNGLIGMEIVNPKNPKDFQQYLLSVCVKYELIYTAGSDYHGLAQDYTNLHEYDEKYLFPLLQKVR